MTQAQWNGIDLLPPPPLSKWRERQRQLTAAAYDETLPVRGRVVHLRTEVCRVRCGVRTRRWYNNRIVRAPYTVDVAVVSCLHCLRLVGYTRQVLGHGGAAV